MPFWSMVVFMVRFCFAKEDAVLNEAIGRIQLLD